MPTIPYDDTGLVILVGDVVSDWALPLKMKTNSVLVVDENKMAY